MIIKNPIKSDFTKNVIRHFSGTAISNLITLISLPILTRLYSPDDFGLFQLMLSTVLTFSVISSLKLELAVVIPKHEVISNTVFKLALVVLFITSTIFAFVFFFGGTIVLSFLNAEKLSPYLIYAAIGIFANGLFQLVQYIPIREKNYSFLAKTKIAQSVLSQSSSLTAGVLGANFLGLYLSMVAGLLLNVVLLLIKKKNLFQLPSTKRLITVLRRYKKFPLINTPMTFLNTASNELPVFMFTYFFSPEVVGFYMAANRLIKKPISMIGQSLSQVYFQSASEAYNNGGSYIIKLFRKTVFRMSLLVGLPLVIVVLFGPDLVSFILGQEWRESGVYMQILSFWLFFQLINYTVGTTFLIIDKQEIGFYLIIISLVVRFLVMYLFRETIISMMLALSISAGLFYLIYILVMYYLLKKSVKKLQNISHTD